MPIKAALNGGGGFNGAPSFVTIGLPSSPISAPALFAAGTGITSNKKIFLAIISSAVLLTSKLSFSTFFILGTGKGFGAIKALPAITEIK